MRNLPGFLSSCRTMKPTIRTFFQSRLFALGLMEIPRSPTRGARSSEKFTSAIFADSACTATAQEAIATRQNVFASIGSVLYSGKEIPRSQKKDNCEGGVPELLQ